MKKYLTLLTSASALVLFAGCESFMRDDGMQKQQTDSLRAHEIQLSQISSRVNTIQDNNADLVRQVSVMNQKIANLEQRNAVLENSVRNLASLRQEVADAKQEVAAEKQERKAAVNAIIDQVSKDMARAINTSRASSGGSSKGGPVGSGEFVEYKVESGATLNAIAKAYGVSTSDIMKANNLSNGSILRVGQTIYIPRKKK